MFRRAVWYKANPRDEGYMHTLFVEHYPGQTFINVDQNADWQGELRTADKIVLLYPDAIGIGFSRFERRVGKIKSAWAEVRVLNGRRRDFLLNASTLFAVRMRRLIERTMAGEFAFLALFVFVTPVLLIIDWLRGRT